MPMLAVAALCLILLGAGLGGYALRYASPPPERQELASMDERGLVASPPLQHALESTPSGDQAKISERLSIKLVATLRTQQGIWCRRFDLLYSGGPHGHSLACRGSDGTWLVPVTVVPQRKKIVPQGKGYEVAGDPPPDDPPGKSQATDENTAMHEAARRVSSGAVVSPAEEKSLIERHWPETF
jgi:hypothetical protein